MPNKNHYNVAIIGGGPAGTACALALRNSGLSVVLIDKDQFPRDKTCGDAIPTPTIKEMRRILAEFDQEFELFLGKYPIPSSSVISEKDESIEVFWKLQAYNSTRIEFDNFLVELVKKYSDTRILENVKVGKLAIKNNKVHIVDRSGDVDITCDIIVGADGANSIVSRLLCKETQEAAAKGVAVRAYYKNVDASLTSNEIYLVEELSGYFWIFPLGDNYFNVGMGVLNQKQEKSKDLKNQFLKVIDTHPVIKKRFGNAQIESKVLGHGLPMGGKLGPISSDRCLLLGDAANLVDPMMGHGIDKAVISGHKSAQVIEKAFQTNRFDRAFFKEYDDSVYKRLGKELKRNYRLMKFLTHNPRITKFLFQVGKKNIGWLTKWYY